METRNVSTADSTTLALPRCPPEAQGVSSADLLHFVETMEQEIDELHSLMLVRRGQVIAEGWWSPYAPERPHLLYSLSKSFTATAAGLAIDAGLLSLDDRAITFFPDDVPNAVSENLAQMTIRHLLTMTTGHTEDTLRFLWDRNQTNWIEAFFEQPVNETPGTHFVYNSGASYLVSAIVQKVTGETVLDFLTPRLLDPLGIVGATWDVCPRGINTGGWGLSLRTEEIAKFGLLYQQRGVWNGERLLPEGWVEAATAAQVPNGDNPTSDWAQGYGYQFWRSRHGAYRGDGACGQFCIVLPEQDAVLAITAGTKDMQGILNLVWEGLLPLLGANPLPENLMERKRLQGKLSTLTLPKPQGLRSSPLAATVSGQTYQFAPDATAFDTLTLHFTDQATILEIRNHDGAHRIDCGVQGVWIESETALETPGFPMAASAPRRLAATGAWTGEQTYTAKFCFVETPFSPTITCAFTGDRILVDFCVNAAFGRSEWPQMVGYRVGANK